MFGEFRKNILFSLLIRTLLISNFPPQRLAQMVKWASLFMKEQVLPGGMYGEFLLFRMGAILGSVLLAIFGSICNLRIVVSAAEGCLWVLASYHNTLYQSGPGNKSRALLYQAVKFADPQRLPGQSTHISCLGDEKRHWTTFFWCSGKKFLLPEALKQFVGEVSNFSVVILLYRYFYFSFLWFSLSLAVSFTLLNMPTEPMKTHYAFYL